MDEKTVASFYQLINNLIDAKLSKVDHLEICQIVSDDNGSGKYNIKLLSGENTIVHDVVTSRKTSFKNGDYVYILKIHNNLSNSIIIGGNSPHIKQTVQVTEEEIIKYRVYFTLGDYVNFGYLSTNPNAERGDPSGTEYDPGTIVYYFVEKYADDVSYRYECSGTQINGDIYRLGSVSIRDQDIILSNISGVTRYNAGQYAITTTVVNGTVGSSSATTIQEGMTATVYISPDAHYDMPYQADFTVTGCTISSFNRSTGALVIAKASGNTDPVTISVTCISTETYDLSFTLGSHIRWVVWTLNGVEQENISSSVTFSNALTYGDSLSWYAVPNNHYETEHDVNNPVIVSKVTDDLSYSITASLVQCAVTFTLGDYVTNAFTSTNSSATSGYDSGHTYEYGTTVYYFVEKYDNDERYSYSCSGTYISGNIYRIGEITSLTENNGNLGALSNVTANPHLYTLTINKNATISKIYYKVGSAATYTESTTTVSTYVPYNSSYSWYAVAASGYSYTEYTSANPCTQTMPASDVSYTPTGTPLYSLNIVLGTGITSILYSIGSKDNFEGPFNSDQTITDLAPGTKYYIYAVPTSSQSATYVVNYYSAGTALEGTISSQDVTETINGIRQYTYTTGTKEGIGSLTAYRSASDYVGATIGQINNNSAIYVNDKLYFAVTGEPGYTITNNYYDASHTLSVYSNVTGVNYVTATIISYTVTANITNGTYLGPGSVNYGTTNTASITPGTGYSYPSSITITGVGIADWTYDNTTGEIMFRNPVDNVVITGTCPGIPLNIPQLNTVCDQYFTKIRFIVTNPSSNPTVNASYDYTYETQSGTFSGTVDLGTIASGATATFYINENGNTGTISEGDVTVIFTATGGYISSQRTKDLLDVTPYTIVTNISHGTVQPGSSSMFFLGQTSTIYVAASQGYDLPDTITVTGASYSWDPGYDDNLGEIIISNATQDVTITISCLQRSLTFLMGTGVVRYDYSLYSFDNYQGPFYADRIEYDIPIGSNYYYYSVPDTGYVTNYPSGSPYAGQLTSQDTTVNLTCIPVYSYSNGTKTGVASLTTYRVSSNYNQASTGALSSSDTIYAGDQIYFVPTASSGYNVSTSYYDSNHTLTVTGNVVGVDYVTASIPTLNPPTVSLVWGSYHEWVDVVVTNPSSNPAVTLSYYVSYDTSTQYYDDADTVGTVAPGSSMTLNFAPSGGGEIISGYIDITISAPGYNSYTLEKDFDE